MKVQGKVISLKEHDMNYRQTRHAYCNCERWIYEGVGKYDIPEIMPQEVDLTDPQIIGFNYAKGEDFPEEEICHFYLDDYQFDRVWKDPDFYIPYMQRFKAVLAPDFSIYDDFPLAVNIYNHYRKYWVARYWQDHGVTVIPSICWGDEASFEYCLDGEPRNSAVSISCVGCNKTKERSKQYWDEFCKVIDILKPSVVLLFTGTSNIQVPNVDTKIIRVTSGNLAGAKKWKESLKDE